MRDRHHMRRAEMDRKQQRIMLRAGFQQAPARHRGVGRPLVRHVVPVRGVDLQRVMDDVAAEDGAAARIREPEQDMAGRMPGRGFDRIGRRTHLKCPVLHRFLRTCPGP